MTYFKGRIHIFLVLFFIGSLSNISCGGTTVKDDNDKNDTPQVRKNKKKTQNIPPQQLKGRNEKGKISADESKKVSIKDTFVVFSHGLGQEDPSFENVLKKDLKNYISKKFTLSAPVITGTAIKSLEEQANELVQNILGLEIKSQDQIVLIGHSQGAARAILAAKKLDIMGYKNLKIICVGGVVIGVKTLENIKNKLDEFTKEKGPFSNFLDKQVSTFNSPGAFKESFIDGIRQNLGIFEQNTPGISDLKVNSSKMSEIKKYLSTTQIPVYLFATKAHLSDAIFPGPYDESIKIINKSYNKCFFKDENSQNDTILAVDTQLGQGIDNNQIIRKIIPGTIVHRNQMKDKKVLEEIAKVI